MKTYIKAKYKEDTGSQEVAFAGDPLKLVGVIVHIIHDLAGELDESQETLFEFIKELAEGAEKHGLFNRDYHQKP